MTSEQHLKRVLGAAQELLKTLHPDCNRNGAKCSLCRVISEGLIDHRRKNLTFNGITDTQSGWASRLGIKQQTLSNRLSNGWTVDEALSTPKMVK